MNSGGISRGQKRYGDKRYSICETNKDGRLISINVLEYAGIIITFVAATHYFLSNPRDTDSQPVARLVADNSASESCGL